MGCGQEFRCVCTKQCVLLAALVAGRRPTSLSSASVAIVVPGPQHQDHKNACHALCVFRIFRLVEAGCGGLDSIPASYLVKNIVLGLFTSRSGCLERLVIPLQISPAWALSVHRHFEHGYCKRRAYECTKQCFRCLTIGPVTRYHTADDYEYPFLTDSRH